MTKEEILADPAFQPLKRCWETPGEMVSGNYFWVYEKAFGFNPRTLFPAFSGLHLKPKGTDGAHPEFPVLAVLGTEEDGEIADRIPNCFRAYPRQDGLVEYDFAPLGSSILKGSLAQTA